MIGALIHILILLVVLVIVFYILKLVSVHFGLPTVAVQIIGLILALILLLYILNTFMPGLKIP
ncbi:MAG TPA: hypothetical protein VJ301_14490 [Propionibacteriaceae bacterium]|jgi:hypothetical protein|nr:hypothetical protein [Propionibacteriaceae bacterium]